MEAYVEKEKKAQYVIMMVFLGETERHFMNDAIKM